MNFETAMYKEIKDFIFNFVFKGKDEAKANELFAKGVLYIKEQIEADAELESIFEDENNAEFVLGQFLLVRDLAN
jgi:hypothetical protein